MKRVIGSFVCMVFGWISLAVINAATGFMVQTTGGDRRSLSGLILICSGFFVLPSWLLIFMPLYTFLPAKSRLWKWYLFMPVGALCGGVAICLISVFEFGFWLFHYTLPAAIVGGVAGLCASLTKNWFVDEHRGGMSLSNLH
jgi:hypothetical protein